MSDASSFCNGSFPENEADAPMATSVAKRSDSAASRSAASSARSRISSMDISPMSVHA